MRIERSFDVDAPLPEVWSLIRDPQAVVACVPGCDSVEEMDASTYRATVTLSVGPIRAAFDLNVMIEEEIPPNYIRTVTTGDEGSRASMVRATSEMHLAEQEGGSTRIIYSSDVDISGRLGRYGAGMMKKLAERKAQDFESAFQARFSIQRQEA